MIQRANQQQPSYKRKLYGKGTYKTYKIGCFGKADCENGIVRIAIFKTEDLRKGWRQPEYTIYLDPYERDFVTYKHEEEKWSDCILYNLPGWYSWNEFEWLDSLFVMPAGRKVLSVHLCGGQYIDAKAATKAIINFQEGIRRDNREERYKRETDPWDEAMKSIPELPKDFKEWAGRWGNDEHLLMYKYDPKGAKTGYCTACQKEVPIKNPKYGDKKKCPKCRRMVEYKSTGKVKYYRTDEKYAYILQKCKEGIWVREFKVWNRYERSKEYKPDVHVWEIRRALWKDGAWVHVFFYGKYKNGEHRFIRGKQTLSYTYRWYAEEGYIYPRNINRIGLERSGLPTLAKKRIEVDAEMYLNKEKSMPVLEQVIKAGLLKLTADYLKIENEAINLDLTQTKLTKVLQIDNARFKRLVQMDGGRVGLMWLQEEKKHNTIYPDKTIKEFEDMEVRPGYIEDMLHYMSVQKTLNYLKKQKILMSHVNTKQVISTWLDYMNMVKRLRMDDTNSLIYKPKDLKRAHDYLVKAVREKALELDALDVLEQFPNVEKRQKEVEEKFTFQDKKYAIVVPTKVEDVLRESKCLNLCLDTTNIYWDRIEQRETYLVWLRRVSDIDKPWYVIEVQPGGSVRQKRTLGDNQNDDYQKAVKFIEKWQKKIKARMTEEDIRLEQVSTEKRLAELDKLRKDGNRIHRGKLQGKLLADVLENDYMDIGGFENVG